MIIRHIELNLDPVLNFRSLKTSFIKLIHNNSLHLINPKLNEYRIWRKIFSILSQNLNLPLFHLFHSIHRIRVSNFTAFQQSKNTAFALSTQFPIRGIPRILSRFGVNSNWEGTRARVSFRDCNSIHVAWTHDGATPIHSVVNHVSPETAESIDQEIGSR